MTSDFPSLAGAGQLCRWSQHPCAGRDAGGTGVAFGVSVGTVGLLISLSAAVVCLSPPFVAWMTSRFDRRTLLSAMLLWIAVGQTASALAPSYPSLLAIQLVMLAFAGGFTPLAAGAAALLVSEDKGAAAISSILVGWALAIAAGLPLVSLIAPHIGWQATYGLIGILAASGLLALLRALPRGLHGTPIIFATWARSGGAVTSCCCC